VLIAEDNAALADVIRFNLSRVGLAVTVARHGQEALDMLRASRFDLVVTDFHMPQLSGQELCEQMRLDPQLELIPVILLSAKGLELDAERLRRELGVRAVLFKPFSPRDLARTVQQHLAAQCEAARL
jgi:CheY-like chemotaxis protein